VLQPADRPAIATARRGVAIGHFGSRYEAKLLVTGKGKSACVDRLNKA
jgi:hypothetical protein